MPIVTTGQITIVDNNDARPIFAQLLAQPSAQQVFTKDESATSYLPDWTTANSNTGLLITPRVYIGSTGSSTEVTGQLTNRRFSTDMSTALTGTAAAISGNASLNASFVGSGTFTVVHNGSGSTLNIKSNFLSTVQSAVIYFEGDYTDPVTGLVSRVVAQITLGMVKTGTNAVFLQTRGQDAIEQATGSAKNVAVIGVDLIRAAGVDTSGITYRWYENNGATQIITGAPFNTEYGLKTTTSLTMPTGSTSDIGVNLPASGAWSAHNTLVIHESAVADLGNFRVEAKDADAVVYQTYFTITDTSDPYQLNILSSAGDKLQNGVGSTTITPEVYYGSNKVSSLTGWTFTWYIYNRNGKRGAFVDATKTALAGGRNITANTSGTSTVFTYSGASITFAAGDLIKVVAAEGTERIYEVASGTGSTVTIRTPSTHSSWLSFTDYPAPTASEFVNGSLFACTSGGGVVTTSGAASFTLTGDDVDVKARLSCDANRP